MSRNMMIMKSPHPSPPPFALLLPFISIYLCFFFFFSPFPFRHSSSWHHSQRAIQLTMRKKKKYTSTDIKMMLLAANNIGFMVKLKIHHLYCVYVTFARVSNNKVDTNSKMLCKPLQHTATQKIDSTVVCFRIESNNLLVWLVLQHFCVFFFPVSFLLNSGVLYNGSTCIIEAFPFIYLCI